MTKHSKHELKRLVEQTAKEIGGFDDRGVWLCIDEIESFGQPVSRVRVWATLHFLPAGSPFDSDDPDLWLWPLRDEMADRLREIMGLIQEVELEWVGVIARVYPGVSFVGRGGHRV